MAELTEIPLELQLKEANCRIKIHLSKGRKFQQFLSPMFLRCFPAITKNHISVDWNTISGVYDRTPTLPITLIDTEILDDWFNHPQVWDVSCDLQHAQCMLALVRHTLLTPYKGQPAIVFGASFVFISAYQACTNLCDGLTFLKGAKEDSDLALSRRSSRPFPRTVHSCFLRPRPRPWWLSSPVLSDRSHLTTTMTMTTMVITTLAPASIDLIPACRRPHTGTLAELAKQVILTRPLPYFTGVPSVYQLTPRSHPVALLVQLQTRSRTRSVVYC